MRGIQMEKSEFIKALEEQIAHLDFIKPGTVPEIELYMDQVTTFMDGHLQNSKRHEEDKVLTKTMINNYAKNKLLPPPEKKKYSKDHMYLLTMIYYLKNILSIGDTQALLKPLTETYFGGQHEALDFSEIYEKLYRGCKQQLTQTVDSLKNSLDISENVFDTEGVTLEELEYLKTISYVAVLGFDVYLKKMLIENLVDQLKESDEENKK